MDELKIAHIIRFLNRFKIFIIYITLKQFDNGSVVVGCPLVFRFTTFGTFIFKLLFVQFEARTPTCLENPHFKYFNKPFL